MSFYMAVGMELIKQHIKTEKENKKKGKSERAKKGKKLSNVELVNEVVSDSDTLGEVEDIIEELNESKKLPKKSTKKKGKKSN